MSTEIQGRNKCEVYNNYPTSIWDLRYLSCECDSNFRRFADFKYGDVRKMHNNMGCGLDIGLSF